MDRGRGEKKKEGRERLEDQPWYYGALPRKEINQHLKENGQFLVRASERSGKLQLIISVCYEAKILHFPLIRDREGWRLEEEAFSSIPALIRLLFFLALIWKKQYTCFQILPKEQATIDEIYSGRNHDADQETGLDVGYAGYQNR